MKMGKNRPIMNYYGFMNDYDFSFCKEEMILYEYDDEFLVLVRNQRLNGISRLRFQEIITIFIYDDAKYFEF